MALWDGPVLLLRGGKSLHFPEGDLEDFFTLFPRAKERNIPDADHWLHISHRDRFVEELRRFLSDEGI